MEEIIFTSYIDSQKTEDSMDEPKHKFTRLVQMA
ncbi:hypothetical protein XMV242_000800 [Marinobacterium sp. xm-v-242]|nr:hypothetical protein [Marinobacterium sp. xm-v-242]NRP76922.1 hypothetical protein [Marinobacterium sp. xm-m-383]